MSQSFSLLHQNAAQGFDTMQLISGANKRARAQFQFNLESVSPLEGTAAASTSATVNVASAMAATATTALGLRLVETGEIIPIGSATAVPEPASMALLAVGLGLLATTQARRQRKHRTDGV